MHNSGTDSKAMKAMNEGQQKVCVIMSVLLLVAFGANVAYSAVSIIFPNTVLSKGLTSTYTGIIIAGYPVAMMLGTNLFTVLLNKCGKKLTLMIGIMLQAISLFVFGYANYIPGAGNGKYIFFVVCFCCRLAQGFGNGCINAATSSIIAFNYADRMGFLMGMQQIFNNAGMLAGPLIGSEIKELFGYVWAFNVNGILLGLLFIVSQVVYPYDPPLGQFEGGENKGGGADITVGRLLRRFNVLSVAGCTCCALFGFTFKESILEPTCMNYFGLSSNDTAMV